MSDHIELMKEFIKEKRSGRRWGLFRFFLWLIVIVLLALVFFASDHSTVDLTGDRNKNYVALIQLNGMIAPEQSFSAGTVLPLLKEAFSDENAKGVVLEINSGGGTPVQAAIIHDAIITLKNKYHKKVVVVGEDLLASGAYYVAVSADKIYVNPNTITGSIGVIMKEFGFPDLLKKIGVERRVYASGQNKDRLDPFLPQNPQDVEKIRHVISEVHANFSHVVMEGRAGKLHADEKDLFSGDFWSGQTALKMGLVDGVGNLIDVLQEEFHVSRYRDYSDSQSILKTVMNQLGMSLNTALTTRQMTMLEKI